MKSTKIVYSGVSAGNLPWINLDDHVDHQDTSWAVWKVGGGTDVNVRLEYTLDNVGFPTSAQTAESSALAITVATFAGSAAGLMSAASFSHVAAALRLVIVSVSGASDIVFQKMQSGD